MNYSDIYSLFKRLKHKTSINVHPHLFRHTHATVFIMKLRILNKFKKDSVIVIYKRLLIYMFIPLKKIYVKIGIKLSINFKFLIKGITMSIPINLPTNSTLINELCTLQSRTINIKGEVLITEIYDDYFLKNDEWHISAFNKFKQFQDSIKNYKDKRKIFSLELKAKI